MAKIQVLWIFGSFIKFVNFGIGDPRISGIGTLCKGTKGSRFLAYVTCPHKWRSRVFDGKKPVSKVKNPVNPRVV